MHKPKILLKQNLRLAVLLLMTPMLGSCSTTFIPGLDRILFSNSSATVGPLVTVEEAVPTETDDDTSTAKQDESVQSKSSPDQNTNTEQQGLVPTNAVGSKESTQSPSDNKIVGDAESETVEELLEGDAAEEPFEDIPIEYGSITGQVLLIDEDGRPEGDAGTMVTLTPVGLNNMEENRQPEVHIIDMKNKIYTPRYSTIHAGDQVVFVNSDRIRHNVFSSSGSNAFDLGTYGAGLKRAVTLKEPGIVKIYCNIHAEMATFVAVGDQGLSTQTNEQGQYAINDVLPGAYELTVWNIRGESKRLVEVKANETLKLVDRLDTTAFKVEPHKNKFGGDYSKNATLFEDEFY